MHTLRRQIAGLQDQASALETCLALGRDPAVLRALGDLHDRPELFEQAARDPRTYFAERGVQLPEDAAITVSTVTTNGRTMRSAVEARFHMPTLTFGVGWSLQAGFYVVTEQWDPFRTVEEQSPCR
jgi:hypothetical protein